MSMWRGCGMAVAAAPCPFAFHSESRRLCRKWFEGHESGTPPYYNLGLGFLLLLFCTYFVCVFVTGESGTLVESGLKKWAGGGGLPPPFPSSPSACIARRRSQLLLGMDVLILWPSGASDNCHLSSQNLWEGKRGLVESTTVLVLTILWQTVWSLLAVWELESSLASSVCRVNVKCVGVEWIPGAHLFVTFYEFTWIEWCWHSV